MANNLLTSDAISAKAIEKLPPQNIEAEKSLLGALLLDKNAAMKITGLIQADDFYRDNHSAIFASMLKLFDNRCPIDLVTLTDQLEKNKMLDKIGGASYIATLANSVTTAAHVVEYANIVSQKATLRRLIAASQDIALMGYHEEMDLSSILDNAESKLFSVSQKYLKQDFIPIKEVLAASFDRIDELHKHKGQLSGVGTGFKDLDRILAGLHNSDLIIVASRPSIGKTTFAMNIGIHAAVKEKIPTGIFSLEMSKEQLIDRVICAEAGVDSWKLRTGNLDDEDFPKIGYAMGVLSEAPIYIDDSPISTVMDIRTKARRLHADFGLGLLIVDYLQLIQGRQFFSEANRVQEISEISRGLKSLARELNIPVVTLSQLSRAVESRPGHIPQLADLRESGSIEQDADIVMFLFREDYYDKDTERKNITDILVKKHRNGPIGDIELYFVAEQLSFKNIETKRTLDKATVRE